MDAMYATQRHIYDATRKYYLLGRDRLIAELDPPADGTVLELGCGTARNLIAAARRWPDARFYGLDISDAMLTTARAHVLRAGLSERIILVQADATRVDPQAAFGLAGFDRVFMSYTLSMIPDWQGAIRQGTALLAQGGRLSIVDFGQQERLPRWWRALLLGWLVRWHVTPRAALREAVAAQGRAGDFAALYRGYAWRATILRP